MPRYEPRTPQSKDKMQTTYQCATALLCLIYLFLKFLQVYIRKSDLNKILCDVRDMDIPDELVERLNAEKQLEIVKRKEKTEAHLYMTVRLLFEDMFYGHQVH